VPYLLGEFFKALTTVSASGIAVDLSGILGDGGGGFDGFECIPADRLVGVLIEDQLSPLGFYAAFRCRVLLLERVQFWRRTRLPLFYKE